MNYPLNRWHLKEALRVLRTGGVIACPSEAVFGISCDPFNPETVMRLLDIKRRPVSAGFIVVGATFEQVEPLVQPLPKAQTKRARDTWPGPVTWLWPVRPEVPNWIHGHRDTIAVRVTNHPLLAALCRLWGGPLISTSANPHGFIPARTTLQLRHYFGNTLDLVLHGRLGDQRRPTEIRNVLNDIRVRPG